ncbi:hypothetical protein DF19_08345 [Streptomyces olindensis]|nr:hypothetical protein DF19_08345 [Streptomyces olindensis]
MSLDQFSWPRQGILDVGIGQKIRGFDVHDLDYVGLRDQQEIRYVMPHSAVDLGGHSEGLGIDGLDGWIKVGQQ